MDKVMQLEEMKNIIDFAWGRHPAEDLYDAGYRKQSDTARELFKEFEDILFQLAYLGADGNYHIRRTNASKVTMLVDEYTELKQRYVKEDGKTQEAENMEIKICTGGHKPPEGYLPYYWISARSADWEELLELTLLHHRNDRVIVSVGRDSYKQVFHILQKHNINHFKIGITSKTCIENVQQIVDEIKANGWEEYIDEDKHFNGYYLLLTELSKHFK